MIKVISLCGNLADGCCPIVEVLETEVRIGEEGNLAVLSKEEWNTLVDKIKTGELETL